MPDLLFELYVEELPASYLDKAIESLGREAAQLLTAERLIPEAKSPTDALVRVTGTPRRIVLHVRDVRAEQPGETEELTGPPVSAAFKDGKPTKAAESFAAKVGVPLDQLAQKDTPKGKYLTGTKRTHARPAASILPRLLERAR